MQFVEVGNAHGCDSWYSTSSGVQLSPRSRSEPPDFRPTPNSQPAGRTVEVIMKHRKRDGPTIYQVLCDLADEAGCRGLLYGLDQQQEGACKLRMPQWRAEDLRSEIQEAYTKWLAAQSHQPGRSSSLQWKLD
eukprot:TRINITY_DN17200_c0_g1_i1.p1 TRINITY_DN17200_c0_g1~~TRINITY_DN17200_c0_g1_i1.p1  ORF type:complete len:133 (-),score=14.83 TRINITY_DN17200_c0_g1_i1:207-605(-)